MLWADSLGQTFCQNPSGGRHGGEMQGQNGAKKGISMVPEVEYRNKEWQGENYIYEKR